MKELASLNKYFYRYRWPLLWGIVFVTLSNVFAIAIGPLVRTAFDLVNDYILSLGHFKGSSHESYIIKEITVSMLFVTGLILLSAIIKGIFMFFMRQGIIVVSRKIEYDMKNEIFDHYQKLSLSFYQKNYTGDLMARISEDVSRVRMYLGPAIMYTVNLVIMFILVISTMLAINVKLSFYVLLPLPFLSISIYFVNSIIEKRSDAIQKQLSLITTRSQETFAGIRVLKAFGVEAEAQKHFEREVEEYRNRSMHLVKANAWFFPLMTLLVGLSTLITVYVGGMEVINGNITPGNIAEFVLYVNMLTWPVASLGWVTSLIQRAAVSQARINEFLHITPDIRSENVEKFCFREAIEFKDVSFSYKAELKPALSGLNFKIKKGERIAILGSTGSGKSSIASLILRMYDVSSGQILVDGKDIRELNLQAYRKAIGYVPQDVFLFSDTIEENIAFGNNMSQGQKIDRAVIAEAARNADVLENIQGFPQGFDTILGERGITLSGGQKQRVAIARALVRNPDILLLDDCLSAVDTKTEAVILENLGQIMKDKTAVIISHRVSSVKNADQIMMLEGGRIIEFGTHESLMELGGKYFDLYMKQTREDVRA